MGTCNALVEYISACWKSLPGMSCDLCGETCDRTHDCGFHQRRSYDCSQATPDGVSSCGQARCTVDHSHFWYASWAHVHCGCIADLWSGLEVHDFFSYYTNLFSCSD